jgi:peptide/nickel transport system substrate-binding protein
MRLAWATRAAAAACLAFGAAAAANPQPAAAEQRVERAYVGLFLKTVRHLHANEGTFDAELLMWVRWRSSNRIDPAELRIENALSLSHHEELTYEQRAGWSRRLWRVGGTFYGRFELSSFPFDQQQLVLKVTHPTLPASVLRLEPDVEGSGVDPLLDIPGWIVDRKFSVFRALERSVRDGSREAEHGFSQVHFRIYLIRPLLSLLTKILLPMFVVLAMGHAAFWLNAKDSEARLMLVSMAIFAGVCVHFTLSETLPDGGELVIADYYLFLVYALLFGDLLGSVVSHVLVHQGRMVAVDRMDRTLRWGLPALLAVAAVYVSIPAKPQPVPPPERRPSAVPQLVVGTTQAPRHLGAGAEGGIERFFTGLFLRPLARLDDHWELQPELAAEVPDFANGLWELRPGGSAAVRWILRPGARWGDGAPMRPEDFTATHAVHPLRGVARVLPTGDGAVLEYEQPRPDAVHDVLLLPAHRFAAGTEPRLAAGQAEYPPLSGPFLLKRWEQDRELLLERNPHHALGRAALESVRVRFFPDKPALLAAVRQGEVHLVAQGDLSVQEAEQLVRAEPHLTMQALDSTVLWHLEVNLDDAVLSDVRVRQALLLGTDREAMLRQLAGGQGAVAHSWLPPQHEGYDPGIRRYAFDPPQAARLLDEAGWRAGLDGMRRGADGAPLRLRVAALPSRRAEAGFLQQAWRPLGIELVFDEIAHEQFLGEYTARRQFPQLAFYGFVATPYELGRKRWDQDRIPTAANNYSGENLTGWRNRRVSEIHRRLETTWNSEARVELLAEQQAVWADELPILPLYTVKSAIVHDARLRGIRPHPSERAYLSWNAEEWSFEP